MATDWVLAFSAVLVALVFMGTVAFQARTAWHAQKLHAASQTQMLALSEKLLMFAMSQGQPASQERAHLAVAETRAPREPRRETPEPVYDEAGALVGMR